MRKNSFYILCGLPFSRKTTLANLLVGGLNIISINLDAINGLFGVGIDGAAISPEEWDRTYAEAYRQIGEALATGHSVLFDATNFTHEQRDMQRNIATRYNIPSQVIYVDVSEEEARQRWLRNRMTHERHDVRDEDFELVVRNFEPPTEDEQVIRYDQSMQFEDWLLHNFMCEA